MGPGNQYAAAQLWSRILKGAKSKDVSGAPAPFNFACPIYGLLYTALRPRTTSNTSRPGGFQRGGVSTAVRAAKVIPFYVGVLVLLR